ncbi:MULTISPECIES: hypothetical protein [unclassified Streptomyces]
MSSRTAASWSAYSRVLAANARRVGRGLQLLSGGSVGRGQLVAHRGLQGA